MTIDHLDQPTPPTNEHHRRIAAVLDHAADTPADRLWLGEILSALETFDGLRGSFDHLTGSPHTRAMVEAEYWRARREITARFDAWASDLEGLRELDHLLDLHLAAANEREQPC